MNWFTRDGDTIWHTIPVADPAFDLGGGGGLCQQGKVSYFSMFWPYLK